MDIHEDKIKIKLPNKRNLVRTIEVGCNVSDSTLLEIANQLCQLVAYRKARKMENG